MFLVPPPAIKEYRLKSLIVFSPLIDAGAVNGIAQAVASAG
jgi:hypothetical protein